MREILASERIKDVSNLIEKSGNSNNPGTLPLEQEIQQKFEDEKFYRDICELYFLPGGQGSVVHLTVKDGLRCFRLKQHLEHMS
jgi:hypothetical protein